MTASDEDAVSRGKNNKKKDGGNGKGNNKKEDKKNKTEKKEATKEPKKAEGKASKTPTASSANSPTEKKNKGTASVWMDGYTHNNTVWIESNFVVAIQQFHFSFRVVSKIRSIKWRFNDHVVAVIRCSCFSQGKKATMAKDRHPARLEM